MGIGEDFARAVATKDEVRLRKLLDSDVSFRGMTPNRFWEGSGPDDVVGVLWEWFDPGDAIEAVEHVETDTFADRERVGYRFRVRNVDGLHAVEQQAYLESAGGSITWLRIMCSGFRPIPDRHRPANWRELGAAIFLALNARDFDTLARMPIDPELEFRSVVAVAEGRIYRGLDGLRQWAEDIDGTWGDYHIEVVHMQEVGEDKAVVVVRNTGIAKASGVPLDMYTSQLWTFRGGRAWRNESFTDPRRAFEAAGVEPDARLPF